MKKVTGFVLGFVFFLAGCATIQPLNTSTGKPEVVIYEVTKKAISDTIINTMLSWDFQVQSSL